MRNLNPKTRPGPGAGIGAGRALSGCFFGLVLAGCASLPENATREQLAQVMQETVGQPVAWREVSSGEVEAQLAAILENPLTPEAAVRIALLHSRSLQRLFAAYGLAQADYLAAASLPNPVLDLEARTRGGSAATNMDLSIVQNFLAVISLKTNRQIADTHLRAAKLQLTDKVLSLQERVLTAYYTHVGNKQMLELRRSVAEAAGASYEFARKLHDAGNIRGLDLSNEQVMYEFAQVAVADAEADLMISRERLGRELELWRPEHAWTAATRLPKMPGTGMELDDFEAQVIARSLRLQADKIMLEGQYRRLGLERSTRFVDDFDLGVAGEREEGDWDRGIALGVSLPIFQQGQPRILRAQSQLASMEMGLYLDAIRVRSMAREAAIGLRQYRRLVVHDLEVRLPLTTRILRQTQLEVNAMQTGLFELMLAKQRQIEAGSAFVGHLRNYWMARVMVEHLLAGGTPEMETGGLQDDATMASSATSGGH